MAKPNRPAIGRRASEIEPRPITWLWPGYLPRGKLVMLDGDPGAGQKRIDHGHRGAREQRCGFPRRYPVQSARSLDVQFRRQCSGYDYT
jgi:hypothetical protein